MRDESILRAACGVRRREAGRGWRRALLLSAAALAVGGCAGFLKQNFAAPIVELKDVRLKGIGFQGGSLDVVLNVYNPNEYRLDASRVTYTLLVDSTQIATGAIDKLVTLVPKKKVEIIMPVSFGTREIMGAMQALSKTGSVDYRVTGEVTVATPFGTMTRPYAANGHFDSAKQLQR